jgi:hypothetical protein
MKEGHMHLFQKPLPKDIPDEALLEEVFEEFCRALEEDELAEEAENLED